MKKQSISLSLIFAFVIFFLTNTKAATYTVTTTTFTGAGSISDAVNSANGNPGKDIINFAIPGTAPFTIIMANELQITDDVLIDGTSQTGYNSLAPKPVIELRNSPGRGIFINTNSAIVTTGSELRALAINSCINQGILVNAPKNIIKGCYIGLGIDGISSNGHGTIALPFPGIEITPVSNTNIIGGTQLSDRNYIAGNTGHGIIMASSSMNYIIGNYIGTNSLGTVAVSNRYMGIEMDNSSNNTIGGASLDSSNILSGNMQNGISVNGCSFVRILGNTIGLQSDRSSALGNSGIGMYIGTSNNVQIGGIGVLPGNIVSSNGNSGINIENSTLVSIKSNIIGTSQNTQIARGNAVHGIQITNCPKTIIGGNHLTEGNIISASGQAGIDFEGNTSKKTIIKGNYIGTDNTGTLALGNGLIGIILKSDSCTIGSTTSGEGNIIVDTKSLCGILIADANANTVTGNFIGAGVGPSTLPNKLDGINISVETPGQTASNNIIRYNVIAYNGQNGVSVGKSLGANIDNHELNNDLRFNSIFCNKQLGIALDTANHADEGNHGKTAPIINNALSTSSKIVGLANGLLATDSVDIYEMVDCPNCDLNPQGKTYIATVVPDAAGNWSYDHGSPITGTFIATATDAQRNTSQFSLCFTPCQAIAKVNPTTFTVQLEMNSSVPLTLTSSSTFSTINPTPGKVFWSLNTPDTTGTAVFSNATSVNFNFSVAGGSGDHGPGLYTVYLIAKQNNCLDTTEAKLNIFFIPNIITPNGDHHNDQWAVGNTAGQFDAKIYNRWGDLVYSKSDYTNEWSGDGLSDGVYYYLLEDKTQSKKSFKGWVQIMK